jgi:hypothetical protein
MVPEKLYAINGAGRIARYNPKLPLKGGWRLATADEIASVADLEWARQSREESDAEQAHFEAEAASHEAGLEQKAIEVRDAALMTAAAERVPQIVVAYAEPPKDSE